jgi:LysM domain
MIYKKGFLAFAAVVTFVSFSNSALADDDLRVENPFITSTSHDNLHECDSELTPADIDNLTRVRDLFYEFEPPKGGDGSDNGPDVNIKRTMVFDVPEFSLAHLGGVLSQSEQDSCEFHLRLMSPSLTFLDSRRFAVQYHMHASYWECGSFLGIGYKTDLGTADADTRIIYSLDANLQVSTESAVTFNEHVDTSFFVDLLSIAIGPIALPLRQLFIQSIKTRVVDQVNRLNLQAGSTTNPAFLALTSGNVSIQAYLKRLDLMHAPAWQLTTQAAASGFLPVSSDLTRFRLVQATVVTPDEGPAAYGIRQGEILYIKDLAKPKPRMHTVARGESLWKIAKTYYPDPHAFLLLEQSNGLRGKKLPVGKSIVAPLLYETCKDEAAGNLVLPGDTVFALRKRLGSTFDPKRGDFRSRRLSLIYPYERIQH